MVLRACAWALTPRRQLSSALFISDRSKLRPVLKPSLDLQKKFENVEELEKNIKLRGMTADAPALKDLWEFYSTLNETRNVLEQRRMDIAGQIKDLKQIGGKEADAEEQKLRLEGRTVREDLKNLLQAFWEVEEKMMISCLGLPNELHSLTPQSESKIYLQHGEYEKQECPRNHLTAGQDLIDYRDPHWYYLKDSAAVFDQALMHFFLDGLRTDGFTTMVPPDFAHSAVVEGCGGSPDSALLLQPSEESFHLVGGASLYPFSAYYAKQTYPKSKLPVKHLVAGKKYIVSDSPGLFGAWQRTAVETFVMTSSETELENQFEKTLGYFIDLYKKLGWSFQVVFLAAPQLHPWETLRASFQMFSQSLNRFVEVGNLSLSGTFLSERVTILLEERDHSKRCPYVLSGTAVDVTQVLACLLEHEKRNLFPPNLKPYALVTV